MADLIILNIKELGKISPIFGSRSVEVRLSMTLDQRQDAIQTLVGGLTYDQWEAMRDHLDKEFAS